MKNAKLELGDQVRDSVTGLVGIAVCRTEWLHGCVRIGVQGLKTKDGKPPEIFTFDEPQLVVTKRQAVPNTKPEPEPTHGPRPDPQQRPDSPSR